MNEAAAALLFDFDGTLADSAPDLGAAANAMRRLRGLEPLPHAELRPWASHGARGLLGAALGLKPGDEDFETHRDEFLAIYEGALCVETRVFAELEPLLQRCERAGLPWGIVTNKASRFTDPLVRALRLNERAAVVVSGDTTAHAKPHPEPLLHAARAIGIEPARCIYVGDDPRDIAAGRAAGMRTVAAGWGYGANSAPADWGADAVALAASDLSGLLDAWNFFGPAPI